EYKYNCYGLVFGAKGSPKGTFIITRKEDVTSLLDKEYDKIDAPNNDQNSTAKGNVVVLYDKNGKPVHACILLDKAQLDGQGRLDKSKTWVQTKNGNVKEQVTTLDKVWDEY